MSARNLEAGLRPGAVAVFGACDRPGTLGATVLANIRAGGFAGPVWPVGAGCPEVGGLACFRDAAALPGAPDLAVVASEPAAVPEAVAAFGARGGKVALVLTPDPGGLRARILDAARPHGVRVIGPNTLGLSVPGLGLEASAALTAARPGRLALVSQSGAIAAALTDWAGEHGIGFSQVVSLGDMADVDIADCLDMLAGDGNTRAILLYFETIPRPRKFLSAARGVARLKPVIAVKAGRHAAGARAAATHTGALGGGDDVVDAALRRAGILRVKGLAELFEAAETLGRFRPLGRGRLGIVTNGGGAGVLATDALADGGGELATLSEATIAALDRTMPPGWSRGNPVDIDADAPPERYAAAIKAVAADRGVDAVLVMNCPTAMAEPEAAARALGSLVERGMVAGKPVLSAWLGGRAARPARAILQEAGVAAYDIPAAAAAAVGHLTRWGRAQAALLRVPDRSEGLSGGAAEARAGAQSVFAGARAAGRAMLHEAEAKAVLAAYGIAVPPIAQAADASGVRDAAAAMLPRHGRVVVKVVSPDVIHKSEVGGVVLDIETAEAAGAAAEGIVERLGRIRPGAGLTGFTVQPMIRRRGAEELILGLGHDPVFGPYLLFGAGGLGVETIRDTAVGLPPLDTALARDLVERTRIGRLLHGYGDRPPADMGAIEAALVALSHLIEDFPLIRGLDINPLLADAAGAVALDARIEIALDDERPAPNPDLAIRPYPAEWRREAVVRGQTFLLRPIHPGDVHLYPDFHSRIRPEHVRLRFLAPRRQIPEEMMLRLTQLDYDRDMAFVALTPEGDLAGVVRLVADPGRRAAEYALIVRSDLQGTGLGSALMQLLLAYARAEGIARLSGPILAENSGMIRLVRRLGFAVAADPDDPALVTSAIDLA